MYNLCAMTVHININLRFIKIKTPTLGIFYENFNRNLVNKNIRWGIIKMILKLLNEYELRIAEHDQYLVVFFKQNPDVIIGRLKVKNSFEREEQKERFKLMPADLVDDRILSLFDGILYTGGIISPVRCMYCHKKLYFDEYTLKDNYTIECCYCHNENKIQFCNSISDIIL